MMIVMMSVCVCVVSISGRRGTTQHIHGWRSTAIFSDKWEQLGMFRLLFGNLWYKVTLGPFVSWSSSPLVVTGTELGFGTPSFTSTKHGKEHRKGKLTRNYRILQIDRKMQKNKFNILQNMPQYSWRHSILKEKWLVVYHRLFLNSLLKQWHSEELLTTPDWDFGSTGRLLVR